MVSSGLLRRVALVRTQKTPVFIVTAVKTSNLTGIPLLVAMQPSGDAPAIMTDVF
jgi:hypothetical protein